MIIYTVKNLWWYGLLFIPVFWLLQNIIHELSHGLAARSFGVHFKLWPFPGYRDGTFYFAHCEFTGGKLLSDDKHAWIMIAPKISNTFLIVISFFLFWFIYNDTFSTMITIFALTNLVDVIAGFWRAFYNKNKSHDFYKFKEYTGWDIQRLREMVVVWFSFLVVLIVLH